MINRQLFIIGLNQQGRIFGLDPGFGDHCGNGFALPANTINGDRVLWG